MLMQSDENYILNCSPHPFSDMSRILGKNEGGGVIEV